MELGSFKDRTVACFSVSAKSQNRLDVMLKWLSELKTKKWIYFIDFFNFDFNFLIKSNWNLTLYMSQI